MSESDDKPEKWEKNLPERASEDVQRSAKEQKDKMSSFVNWQKCEHAEDAEHEWPRLAWDILMKRRGSLKKEIRQPDINGKFEREQAVTLDRISWYCWVVRVTKWKQ